MPAPATADEFLSLIAKSGVLDEARLQAHLKRLGESAPMPTEPNKLADLLVREGVLTHFQAQQLLQGKWKRFSIGKYKILEKLGVGGMGHVFLCEHKLMRRRVAVKVLPTNKASNPASLERFYREARAVAALDHPNIVRAYDIDQDEHLHFIVLEFVDGTNLQDLVKKVGPLDPVRACHYIYGAAVGLQHAHEMGLVHRDIKPGNILVDRAGVVKVLDMGLARFFHDDDDHLTKKYDENILGTADYLAPEQALDSHTVDIRADIYSLGGTFYFLLTGQAPFPEGSVAQKLLWHQIRDPEPVRSIRPEVPADLADVVARMMAKDVTRRYQTPAEVMAALARWVQTPIPPPADRELPQLSPAAQAVGGPAPATTRTGSSATVDANGTGAGSGSPLSSGTLAAQGQPTLVAPTLAAAAAPTAPAQALPVAAPPANSAGVWDELTADTRTDARADTDRTGSRSKLRPATAPNPARRRVLLAALGGVGLLALLVGGAVGLYLAFRPAKGVPAAGEDGPETWYVSHSPATSPDPDRTLETLRGALEQAGEADTILILDDQLDEPPVLLYDGRGAKKGLTIAAGNEAKSVTWTPRVTAGRPLAALDIQGVENVRVAGLVLELGGAIESGISVGRPNPGLVIENVTVHNPRTAGFRFQLASGEPNRPIRLTRCRVTTTALIDAGVLFAVTNRQVVVEHCRLEGAGQAAGVKVDGVVQDVELRNNRIFRFAHGVALTGKPPADAAFSLMVSNNTFHSIAAGVRIEQPLAGPQQLILTQNYFAATKEIATTPGPAANVKGLKFADNSRDKGSKEGKLPVGAIPTEDVTLPANPAAATFLFAPAGKLSAVGPRKVPVGAQPE